MVPEKKVAEIINRKKKYRNLFQTSSDLFIHASFCIFCAVYTFFSCFECLFLFHSLWCQCPQPTVWILIAFWCVFSFVVYKVRDTTERKLNQEWKRKQWRRGRDGGRSYHPRFSLHAVYLALTLWITREKTQQKIFKNRQLCGLQFWLISWHSSS